MTGAMPTSVRGRASGFRLPVQPVRRAHERSRTAGLSLEALTVGVVSLLFAAWVLHLWRADLAVPLRYGPVDDTRFYLMLVKGIVDHGSYLSNHSLGAPFGQQLSDYPQGGDNISLLLIWVLAQFTANAAVVVNLFYLLTFPMAAVSAHLVMRSFNIAPRPAGVAAVLFSLLSYHFFRGESHLLLSAYFAVPLAGYLFLKLMAGAPLFVRRPGPGRGSWLTKRSVGTIAICAAVGAANLYYATFAALILLGGGLAAAAMRRRGGALQAVVLVGLIAASVALNLSPSLAYRAEHGTNSALERSAAFTEHSDEGFSLGLANLILPAPGSRIAPLRSLARRYDEVIAPGYCEACYASLGTVGAVGFAGLFLSMLAALLGASGALLARPLLRHASLGVLLALGLATVGGIASLIEVFVTPDVRAWNRISVFIAFLSLLAVAVLLEAATRRLASRRQGGRAATALLTAVLVFGVFDQSSDSFVPAYATAAKQWHSDQRFVDEIERRLGRGASVFELPYVPFPEGYPETPVGDRYATYATKYEPVRGYLHSATLRWSYGAIKGRPQDWSAQLAGQPLSYVVAAAVSAGFDGLWIDPAAFEPRKALELRTSLQALLRAPPLVSQAGDLWFFDLRRYLARLRAASPPARLELLRHETLDPVRVACTPSGVRFDNPSRGALAVTLELTVPRSDSPYATRGSVVPDGQASDIPTAAKISIRRRLLLAPGLSAISVPGAGLPPGALARPLLVTVTPEGLEPFASATTRTADTLVPGLSGPPCG